MKRRDFLTTLALLGAATGRVFAVADSGEGQGVLLGAAWRGPKPNDPYFAGVLAADWASRKLNIRHAVQLPTRPHGLLAEPGGGLLVTGVRPGGWMLRLDAAGGVAAKTVLDEAAPVRLNGHAIASADGRLIYSSETDYGSGRGRIGVRDAATLKKLDEWDSHGIEPHQLLLDGEGRLLIAHGGISRTLEDRKVAIERMDASLVRLDGRSGRLERQWRLADRRLSLRHLAWSNDGQGRLGVAMQAEHDDPAARRAAPVLAVLQDESLFVPTRDGAGAGYAGDIAPALGGGFVLSNNQTGLAHLWHPARPETLQPVVELAETYALAPWAGPRPGGGVLVATGLGLVRWHVDAKPLFLPWPQAMALDNHWVVLEAA